MRRCATDKIMKRTGPAGGVAASCASVEDIRGVQATVLLNKGYEGDLTSAEGWKFLEEDADALLIDVRTIAEWIYVGLPDLSELDRTVICVQWKQWPDMTANPEFVSHVEAEGVTRDRPLLLLCRSGVRSRDAAVALTAAGFGPCYNISDGFEGDKDSARHRGKLNGWKVAGLPWVQQ